MRIASIIGCVVFVLCLVTASVAEYVGGRLCTPTLGFLGLAALGLAFPTGISLAALLIASLAMRRHRKWTIGAFAVTVTAAAIFIISFKQPLPRFLEGFRDHFAADVGYPTMRQFAREFPRTSGDAGIGNPKWSDAPSPERQKRWDDLASRYPFLNWGDGANVVFARDGVVEVSWGGGLAGHWGFQVSLDGGIENPDPNHTTTLKVADDIQFVYED